MKCFITLGKIGDEFELIAGPNPDYAGQAQVLKDSTVNGSVYDLITLVDVGRGTVKRRRPAKIEADAKPTKKAKQ
jgi:hypothetical protein